jgi:hypothetical protein
MSFQDRLGQTSEAVPVPYHWIDGARGLAGARCSCRSPMVMASLNPCALDRPWLVATSHGGSDDHVGLRLRKKKWRPWEDGDLIKVIWRPWILYPQRVGVWPTYQELPATAVKKYKPHLIPMVHIAPSVLSRMVGHIQMLPTVLRKTVMYCNNSRPFS